MLSKSDIAFIKSLHRASARREHGLFVAEGTKLVHDMLGYFRCQLLVASESAYSTLNARLADLPQRLHPRRTEQVTDGFPFERISALHTPQPLLALFELPEYSLESLSTEHDLALLLDEVQDPGNMGTIIRTANWFGVRHILLTEGCADAFSPKVVQASMGALSQVATVRLEQPTEHFLSSYSGRIYGTFLDGSDLYAPGTISNEDHPRLLIMGNEGKGIRSSLEAYITDRLYIPPYTPIEELASESLNVAIATAICLSELRHPR